MAEVVAVRDAMFVVEPGQLTVCHSFVSDGQWQFLGDCTHALAGQTVPVVPIPDM